MPETIGPHAGIIRTKGQPMKVNRAAPNAPSVIYDAVLVPAGVGPTLAAMPLAQRFMHEAFRHGKPIAVAPDAQVLLEAAGVPSSAEGISIGVSKKGLSEFVGNIGQHRFPRRVSVLNAS